MLREIDPRAIHTYPKENQIEEVVMKRTIAVGLALATALLGAAAPSTAFVPNGNEMAQMNYGRGGRTERWGDRDRADAIDLEGRWIAKRGFGVPSYAYSPEGTSLRAAALPPRMVIDQRRNVIRVENFRGRVLQQIVIGDLRGANRGGYIVGQWRDSKLLTVRSGIQDTRIIQTFALANRGRTLVVHTRQDGRGTRHDVEFTNVYQRA